MKNSKLLQYSKVRKTGGINRVYNMLDDTQKAQVKSLVTDYHWSVSSAIEIVYLFGMPRKPYNHKTGEARYV